MPGLEDWQEYRWIRERSVCRRFQEAVPITGRRMRR